MISITFNQGQALAKIQALAASAKNPRAVLLSCGRELSLRLKRHFREKNQREPNKLGGKRKNFWNQIAQSVQAPVITADGLGVAVTIADSRFAQKVFGGRIQARQAQVLTIPQTPAAYGRSASQFENETGLKLVLLKPRGSSGGGGGSKFQTAVLAAANNRQLTVHYVLTPSVMQEPDPTALPDMSDGSELAQALTARAEAAIKKETGGKE